MRRWMTSNRAKILRCIRGGSPHPALRSALSRLGGAAELDEIGFDVSARAVARPLTYEVALVLDTWTRTLLAD